MPNLQNQSLAESGQIVTTGDTGVVTSTMIADGTIANADVSTSAAIDLSKLASGSSAQIVLANSTGVATYTAVSGDITITNAGVTALASNITISNNLTVTGDLTVSGNTTTLNTANLNVEDNFILLNSGETGSPTLDSGLEVERGTSTNVFIRWNETTDRWQFTNDGSTYNNFGVGALLTSSATAPVSPAAEDLWFNSTTGAAFIYYNSAWVELGGGTMSPYQATSSTRPSSPWTGQTVYETDTNTNLQYNGSAWVCITPKGASVLTDQSTSSASFADLATAGPSVTINTGSSALVTVSATTYRATGTGNTGMLGVNVSGDTTMAANSNYGSRVSYTTAAHSHVLGSSFVLTGLTPGSNTFKLQYNVDGGTVNFLNRYITVVGIP